MTSGGGRSGLARRLLTLALSTAVLLGVAAPAQAVPSAAGPRLDAGALFDALAGAVSGTLSDLLPAPSQLVLDGTTHDISPSTPWTRFEGPVNAVAGNLAFGVIDLAIPSVGFPTAMGRTYSSASTGSGQLGFRWTWSYGISVTEAPDDVLVTWGDGRQDRHVETGLDTWDPPTGIHDTLLRSDDGTLRLRTPDQTVYRFAADGHLRSITDEPGNRLVIAYAEPTSTPAPEPTDAPGPTPEPTMTPDPTPEPSPAP